ncbi:MAG: class I SAM-dependent methyltransferase [Candidatus Levybacteria bacterium]|nr:class I SAM-dependent methyltransferase [Candidatus Levybacteria bacterium]
MVSEVFDGRGQDGGSPKQRILVPLAQVEEGSNMVVARSVGEHTPNPDVPQGYSLHPDFSHLKINVNGNGKPTGLIPPSNEIILLMNRYLDETDYSLNGFLSHALRDKTESADSAISVLEVGGGYESLCAIGIGAGDPSIAITNVDIFLQNAVQGWGSRPGNVTPILADARDIPLPDDSQDIVYSSRLLQYLEADDFTAAFREIVRVMKPGGEAVLFDCPFEAGRRMSLVNRLAWESGLRVYDWDSNIGIGTVLTFSKPEKPAPEI